MHGPYAMGCLMGCSSWVEADRERSMANVWGALAILWWELIKNKIMNKLESPKLGEALLYIESIDFAMSSFIQWLILKKEAYQVFMRFLVNWHASIHKIKTSSDFDTYKMQGCVKNVEIKYQTASQWNGLSKRVFEALQILIEINVVKSTLRGKPPRGYQIGSSHFTNTSRLLAGYFHSKHVWKSVMIPLVYQLGLAFLVALTLLNLIPPGLAHVRFLPGGCYVAVADAYLGE